MAASLDTLIPEFRAKVVELLSRCKAKGCEMRPYMTLRTPEEQAKLWRQSHASDEIAAKLAELDAKGATWLAGVLRAVGPQHGDPVTNALPGLSWHQWGEAVDCFWVVQGKAEWSAQKLVDGRNGYRVYAEEARALGLTAGGLWPTLKDWPHVQWRKDNSPLTTMTLAAVDAEMRKRFGAA